LEVALGKDKRQSVPSQSQHRGEILKIGTKKVIAKRRDETNGLVWTRYLLVNAETEAGIRKAMSELLMMKN